MQPRSHTVTPDPFREGAASGVRVTASHAFAPVTRTHSPQRLPHLPMERRVKGASISGPVPSSISVKASLGRRTEAAGWVAAAAVWTAAELGVCSRLLDLRGAQFGGCREARGLHQTRKESGRPPLNAS